MGDRRIRSSDLEPAKRGLRRRTHVSTQLLRRQIRDGSPASTIFTVPVLQNQKPALDRSVPPMLAPYPTGARV